MVKYNREKVNKEMDKLISSLQIQKQVADVSSESFKIFSYVNVDRKYRRHISFTQALLCKCINSLDAIMADLNAMGKDNIFYMIT